MSRLAPRTTNGGVTPASSTSSASQVAQLNSSITSPPGCRFSFIKQLFRKPKVRICAAENLVFKHREAFAL